MTAHFGGDEMARTSRRMFNHAVGFLACRKGNFALTTAILVVPVVGTAGLALDYGRALEVHTSLQDAGDAAALAGVQVGETGDVSHFLNYAEDMMLSQYGDGSGITNLQVAGKWLNSTDFEVSTSASVPLTLTAVLPGVGNGMSVSTTSVAHISEPQYHYFPPSVSELDPDAADYNRLSVYCYDPTKKNDPATKGRTKMTTIADNAGTKYKYTMPQCQSGETLSFKLLNVRNARTQPAKWNNAKAERYEYYTDTVVTNGKTHYGLGGANIVETILCDRKEQCVPQSQGGIIPEGANRTPQNDTRPCAPSKFMYYGWEDRPPNGSSGSDQDYNDIRIVIACPSIEATGSRLVRLLK